VHFFAGGGIARVAGVEGAIGAPDDVDEVHRSNCTVARTRAKRCSGGDFSTVHAGQEIVALDQNSGARARLVGGGRDRPHHSTVAGHFRALASSCPVGERQSKFQIGLNLKKIFSPEQNSGARNVFDGSLVPDRFSDVAEVHRFLKRESDGTHGP
jgi:hypothetical protein